MKVGDLVELWGKDRYGLNGPHHIGVLIGWDHGARGWRVLVDEKTETFPSTWWTVMKVGKNEHR